MRHFVFSQLLFSSASTKARAMYQRFVLLRRGEQH
jgi:hypothetical protein